MCVCVYVCNKKNVKHGFCIKCKRWRGMGAIWLMAEIVWHFLSVYSQAICNTKSHFYVCIVFWCEMAHLHVICSFFLISCFFLVTAALFCCCCQCQWIYIYAGGTSVVNSFRCVACFASFLIIEHLYGRERAKNTNNFLLSFRTIFNSQLPNHCVLFACCWGDGGAAGGEWNEIGTRITANEILCVV